MRKEITVGHRKRVLDLSRPVVRFEQNPILTPNEVNRIWREPERQVLTVHNSGVCEFNGETIMLFRSHLRNGVSVIGLARSKNGISNWRVDSKPFIVSSSEEDAGGVEDPRITKIDNTFLITYSAYSAEVPDSVKVHLASTKDFRSLKRHGPVSEKDMRNVALFPERIGKKYWALFRINDKENEKSGNHADGLFAKMFLGWTDDVLSGDWNLEEKPVIETGRGPSPFQNKIGAGAPPILTKHGFLSIFHGVRKTMDGNPYSLGVSFHSLDDPTKCKVCAFPILMPSAADCRISEDCYVHVPQVVFSCGAIRDSNGVIRIYYGGNDTVMNVAFSHEDILAEMCEKFPLNA